MVPKFKWVAVTTAELSIPKSNCSGFRSDLMTTLILEFWTRCCFLVCSSLSLSKMAPYPSGKGKAGIAFCGGSNPSGAFAT